MHSPAVLLSSLLFPAALWLLLVLPLVVVLGLYTEWRRRVGLARLLGHGAATAAAAVSRTRRRVKRTLVLLGLAALVLALARPHWGAPEERRVEGRDLVIALDVSRSMLTEDVAPNRLDRGRAEVRGLIRQAAARGGDRVGLVAFAGRAVVVCPLTSNFDHLVQVLDRLAPASVRPGGTFIGPAIQAAVEALEPGQAGFKDILLVSDGGDQGSDLRQAADQAHRAGVTIDALGIGSSGPPQPIPILDAHGHRTVVTDHGQPVLTRRDDRSLIAVARATGGQYWPVDGNTPGRELVVTQGWATRARRTLDQDRTDRLPDRSGWFLAAAAAALTIEWELTDRRRHRATAANRMADRRPPARSAPAVIAGLVLMGLAVAATPITAVRRGNALFARGAYAAALREYQRAADQAPNSPIVAFDRATALAARGDWDQAQALFLAVRQRARGGLAAEVLYALGNCELRWALGEARAAAIGHARRAIDLYRDCLAYEHDPAALVQSPRLADCLADARVNLEIAAAVLAHGLAAQRQDSRSARSQPPRRNPPNRLDQPNPQSASHPEAGSPTPGTANPMGGLSRAAADRMLRQAIRRIRRAQSRRLAPAAAVEGPGDEHDW